MTTDARPEVFTDEQLVYSASARCPCGEGMAYVKGRASKDMDYWDCAGILTGRAPTRAQLDADGKPPVTHEAQLPFAFWKVKSEINGNGATTRPS